LIDGFAFRLRVLMLLQDPRADNHNQLQGGPEKTASISPFSLDKKGAQEASPETEAGAMATRHDHCRLEKSFTVGGRPRALTQDSPHSPLKEVLETDGRFPASENIQYKKLYHNCHRQAQA
jgi:hypothetical protein